MMHMRKKKMNNEDIRHIYIQFRKAQAEKMGRGYRIPKDFDAHLNKMKEQNRKKLISITKFFLTKWENIDPYEYFKCGFSLWKNFSYIKFLDEKVMKHYISRDKMKKRETRLFKKSIIGSTSYVKNWMRENNIYSLNDYINLSDGEIKVAVRHYVKGKIDNGFFVFLLTKGLTLNNNEFNYVPYIKKNYRKMKNNILKLSKFMKKVEEKLNEY